MSTMRKQRGWVGIIVLLIALLIVAVLSQKLLKQMGLFPEDRVMTKAGPGVPGPAGTVPVEPTGATPMIQGNPIERAKGVESTLQQQSQDMRQRIDAQTK